MGQNDTLIRIEMGTTWWEKLVSVFVGILAGIAIIAAIVFTAGAAAAVASAVIGATVTASIGTGAVLVATTVGVMSGVAFYNTQFPKDIFLPVYTLSPEEIFKGQVLLFDIDFFNPVETIYVRLDDNTNLNMNDYDTDKELNDAIGDRKIEGYFYSMEGTSISTNTYSSPNDFNNAVKNGSIARTSKQNTALDLQSLVSQWYSAIRNIAIVLAMSVLLYIGIRMMLTTVAQDKAKYKQMLVDWLISICLLFFMHYIMAFSISIVNELTKVLTISNEDDGTGYSATLELDKDGKIEEKIKALGDGYEELIQEGTNQDGETSKFLLWPTNLMGQLRVQCQMSYGDASFVGYGLCFFLLAFLTIFYIFTYLKRVLYMAFLTMIAPLVALTYPIDKISDGQAQAFNKWLKEYIFNLLIQPLHLLIYTVLVTSAFDLAGKNPIYSIVAIMFMIPAEKLMRSFFGFEKASTPGNLATAVAGGSLLNQGLQNLLHKGPQGHKGGSGKGGNNSEGENSNIRTGFSGNEAEPIDSVSENIRLNGGTEGALPDGENLQGTGGPSVADALPLNEDPVRRAQREALEERIADGQMTVDELTDEQRDMLGIRMANNESEMNNNYENNLPTSDNSVSEHITNSNNGERRRIKGKASRMKDAVFVGAKHFGRDYKKNLKAGMKQIPRGVGGAALGGLAGGLALGFGMATGDPKNALAWTGAATTAGVLAGSNITGAVGDSINTNQKSAGRTAMERAYYGDDYDRHVAEKNQKKWKKNSENRTQLEQYLGDKQTKELYDSGRIDEYLKNDISDTKLIAAMEKAMADDKNNANFNDMLVASQARNIYGNGKTRLGQKAKEELHKDYEGQFKERGVSESKAKETAKLISNRVDKINELYSEF